MGGDGEFSPGELLDAGFESSAGIVCGHDLADGADQVAVATRVLDGVSVGPPNSEQRLDNFLVQRLGQLPLDVLAA